MPRNDQITRQWHLLRRLENSRGLTLPELVDSVPDDFPKNGRTVRRAQLFGVDLGRVRGACEEGTERSGLHPGDRLHLRSKDFPCEEGTERLIDSPRDAFIQIFG
jgi:hypothetical protein